MRSLLAALIVALSGCSLTPQMFPQHPDDIGVAGAPLEQAYDPALQSRWQAYATGISYARKVPYVPPDVGVVSYQRAEEGLRCRLGEGELVIGAGEVRYLLLQARPQPHGEPALSGRPPILERAIRAAAAAAGEPLPDGAGSSLATLDRSPPAVAGQLGQLADITPREVVALAASDRQLAIRRLRGPLALRGSRTAPNQHRIVAVLDVTFDLVVVSGRAGQRLETWVIPVRAAYPLPWLRFGAS